MTTCLYPRTHATRIDDTRECFFQRLQDHWVAGTRCTVSGAVTGAKYGREADAWAAYDKARADHFGLGDNFKDC